MTATAFAPRLLRLSEAARLLGVSVDTLERLIADGTLEAIRLGGNGWRRVRREDVERLISGDAKKA